MPVAAIGAPLAGSLLPWVDRDLGNGYSREEFKAGAEGNKILGLTTTPVPIDGICVRIGAMRCHSQAVTIKLKRAMPIAEIERLLAGAHAWVRIVPNEREATLAQLTPAAVTGKLDIAVGRIRHLAMGEDYITAFTVGDQLLWGAAEPLRRMLRLLVER
jgi:aspartate-semialdehyde dehydrogenase